MGKIKSVKRLMQKKDYSGGDVTYGYVKGSEKERMPELESADTVNDF